jgi:hypothetical protein
MTGRESDSERSNRTITTGDTPPWKGTAKNSEMRCHDSGGSHKSQIQEVRLPSGHWVLVETLGEFYPTRDAARAAKRRIVVSRRQGEIEVESLELLFERAVNRLSADHLSAIFDDTQWTGTPRP